MSRKIFLTLSLALPMLLGLVTSAVAGWSHERGGSYGVFHKHHNACGSVYAAKYQHRRPHYYTVGVKAGRYTWRKRRVRVGTLRRRGRAVPHYRWVRQRVLVRPVRYRVRKHRAHGRWTTSAIVIKGKSRWQRRSRC